MRLPDKPSDLIELAMADLDRSVSQGHNGVEYVQYKDDLFVSLDQAGKPVVCRD